MEPSSKGETMSLMISVTDVEHVLLVDGWHQVRDFSFDVDRYEFTEARGRRTLAIGGAEEHVSRTGATWTEPDGAVVVCPLSSILAIKWVGEQKVSRRRRGEPTTVPAMRARPGPVSPADPTRRGSPRRAGFGRS
jgi:hypothetical protein